MLASQLALVAAPGVIFFVLAVLFLYKAAQICLHTSSGLYECGLTEGNIEATRTTQTTTRGTQTCDLQERENSTTIFL